MSTGVRLASYRPARDSGATQCGESKLLGDCPVHTPPVTDWETEAQRTGLGGNCLKSQGKLMAEVGGQLPSRFQVLLLAGAPGSHVVA